MSTATRGGYSFPLLAAGLLGLTGVAIGAFGAHALKATLMERGMIQAWETGSRYHLFHAIALVGLAAWVRGVSANDGGRLMGWASSLWCIGIVLFSGSLYWLALGGPRWLGPVTPLGGVALMAGWLLVAIAAFSKRE
jgi:uncharacterized membrane protein YgdD (TMEM256/DUF423 family)